MADIPGTFTGLSALLVAVLGAVRPAAAAVPIVTAPTALVAPVGYSTVIGGASVAGFDEGPLRLVVTVSSGVLELPASTLDVTIPAGYPELGTAGPQLAIEGGESAINSALAELSWLAQSPGPVELTVDVAPAGAAYEPDGDHFYQLVTAPSPVSWDAARDVAASMTFHDRPGSLAAITTDAERALLARIAPVDAWVGAADLEPPAGARWLDAPDPNSSIANFIVEYGDPPADGGPVVAQAVAVLSAALPPSAPAVGAVSAGAGEATVSWQEPPAGSGAPVLGYVVTGDPSGWCAVPATQLSCVLRGLVGGAAHTFRVAAINEVGLGAWSAPSAAVTPTARVMSPVDTTVQPFPNEAPVTDPAPVSTAPAPTAVDDTEAPPADGSAPTIAPDPEMTTTTTTTTTPATTPPTAVADAPAADAAPAATDAAPMVGGGEPQLTVVFGVGPGAGVDGAPFTVRAKFLSPGTVVTVIAHSDPVVLGTVDVAADGTLTWVGELPGGLADGDHTLVAEGVGHDGSRVERTMSFTAESGRLVRIGAATLATVAPSTSTTVPTATAASGAEATAPATTESSGGGLPARALAALFVVGAVAVLWWRARGRAGAHAVPAEHHTTNDATGASRPGRTGASPDAAASRSHPPARAGARRRSRRQPVNTI